jgi:hypothetical protein
MQNPTTWPDFLQTMIFQLWTFNAIVPCLSNPTLPSLLNSDILYTLFHCLGLVQAQLALPPEYRSSLTLVTNAFRL